MADHGRYEKLAVGHVLGGLDTAEAAAFRSHLVSCDACRNRVAELRDIATDLEAAEREERARALVRTELPRRADPDEGQGGHTPLVTVRHVTIATIVVLVLAAAMAFWNLHLRTNLAARTAVAEAHADTLRELSSGVVVPLSLAEGISGLAVVDDEHVAFSLGGVADVGPDESIVAWLLDGEGAATSDSSLLARPGALDGGSISGVVTIGDARELVVSRETGTPGTQPAGDVLARMDVAVQASDP